MQAPINVNLFELPLIIASPVVYFVALTQPGALVSAILDPSTTVVSVTSCTPGTVTANQLIINCQ